MASVRMQNFARIVDVKLEAVRAALAWNVVLRDPRVPVGEDQMNAIVFGSGGEPEPGSLTGNVETCTAEFSIGLVVLETADATAEELLDAGFVAVCDALLDPNDIQNGNLAVSVMRGGMSPPFVGKSQSGARIVGVQEIGFAVEYWAREGDASSVGP